MSSDIYESFQFTRYLYEVEEVKLALMLAMLNKQESAVFWAYELYYSGLIQELTSFWLSIYYNFYATLNPSFETYLYKKREVLLENKEDNVHLVSMIVHNFMIRPHTTDVFFLQKIMEKEQEKEKEPEKEKEKEKKSLPDWLEKEDWWNLARLLFCNLTQSELISAFETIIDFYQEKQGIALKKKEMLKDYEKKRKANPDLERKILFSRMLHWASLSKQIPMGKKIYVHIDPEEVVLYETIHVDVKEKGNGQRNPLLPAYKILGLSAVYFIDESSSLGLFQLKRNHQDIEHAYLEKWLFHASRSPLWEKRILDHHGRIDNKRQSVEFEDDDWLETFYEQYGYEPDEQPVEIQNKSIQPLHNGKTWYEFYTNHKGRGVLLLEESHFTPLNI